MTAADVGGEPAPQPIYSIGAVASMLGVETSTLRAWEDRYGVVVPARSQGGQRIYSRDELERLRFVVDHIAGGASAADAHRLLAAHSGDVQGLRRPAAVTTVILLAERDRYAADLLEYFLRTEGFDVGQAFDRRQAEELFAERGPDLSVVDLLIPGGGLELCARLTGGGRPVLATSALDLADDALAAGASAFMAKPVVPLRFVSTVRDLLGQSALTRRALANIS